ncbi:hypothetical protein S83_043930, partial [Arachis hypogaea]
AGDAWFLNTPEQSLSFILADQGFDVWIGNVRGTRWSHEILGLELAGISPVVMILDIILFTCYLVVVV